MQRASCDRSSACLENVGLLIFKTVSRSPTLIIIDNSIWLSHGDFYVGVSRRTWKDTQLHTSPSCPALQLHLHNGLSSQITCRLKQPPSLLSKNSTIFYLLEIFLTFFPSPRNLIPSSFWFIPLQKKQTITSKRILKYPPRRELLSRYK